MLNAIAKLLNLRTMEERLEGWGPGSTVPEPEFRGFDLSRLHAPAAQPRPAELGAANTAHEPRTLRELGVDGALAAELEWWFGALGLVDGDRVTGFTFRSPDGTTHALRTERAADTRPADRAA